MSFGLELTVSSIKMLLRCPAEFYNRHILQVVRDYEEDVETLRFGSLIHEALDAYYTRGRAACDSLIYQKAISGSDAAKALGMMDAYSLAPGQWEKEKIFTIPLSDGFRFSGRVDGYMDTPSEIVILEHKTASNVNENYLDSIWTDFQIHAYAWALEKHLKKPVRSVVYDVLIKPGIVQHKGETDAEFEARRDALAAKSKSGKSSAKKKEAETDESYRERVAEWCKNKAANIQQAVLLDRRNIEEAGGLVLASVNEVLRRQREMGFFKNTDACMSFSRRCSYWQLCASHHSPVILQNNYKFEKPNKELWSHGLQNTKCANGAGHTA